jgi:hypothetical protein
MRVAVEERSTNGGSRELQLDVQETSLRVRDLLRSYVYGQVDYRTERPPSRLRRLLHGRPNTPSVDPEKEYEKALNSFMSGQVLLLIGDRQVTDPDAVIDLASSRRVTFLRLIPLIGG